MKFRSHSESHIVELEDGSQWQVFPSDLDLTLAWKPETDLTGTMTWPRTRWSAAALRSASYRPAKAGLCARSRTR